MPPLRRRMPFFSGASEAWTPASLGANLKGWWKADAGVKASTAALFASASSESLSNSGTARLRGQSGTGGWSRWGWFYLTTLAATLHLNDVGSPGNDGYHTEVDATGTFQLRAGTGSANTTKTRTGTALTTATWYFLAFGYDGTNIWLSINNEARQTAAHATYSPGTGAFRFGSDNGPANFLNGRMVCWGGCDGEIDTTQQTALYNAGVPLRYLSLPTDVKALVNATGFFYNLGENSGTRADSTAGAATLTDNNTVTAEAAPTTLFYDVVDGDRVAKWEDQSGGSQHLSNPLFSERPTLTMNVVNGKPVLRFSGSSQRLDTATSPSIPTSPPFTAWTLSSIDTVATNRILCGKAAGSGGWRLFELEADDGFYLQTPAVKNYAWASQWVAGTFFSFIVDMDSAFDCVLYKSGVSQGQVTHTAGPGANTGAFSIGRGAASDDWDGDVAEALVYSEILTAGERASLVAYSTSRYAV